MTRDPARSHDTNVRAQPAEAPLRALIALIARQAAREAMEESQAQTENPRDAPFHSHKD
jgi:hypothetical protein